MLFLSYSIKNVLMKANRSNLNVSLLLIPRTGPFSNSSVHNYTQMPRLELKGRPTYQLEKIILSIKYFLFFLLKDAHGKGLF